jgi:hypothetical protein
MKKIFSLPRLFITTCILFISSHITAQTLAEGFENGLPSSGSSTVQDFTLSSGIWSILKGASTGTKHTGSLGLKLSAGSTTAPTYTTAPGINTVNTVSFWAKGSSNTTVTIQKSVNGGAYTTVVAQAITTTFTLYNITVNETGNNVRIRFTNFTSQTHYIDDVTIAGGAASPSLTVTPSSLAFGNVTVNTSAAEKTFTVTGTALSAASGNITISAPAGYLVSPTGGSGYASFIAIPYSGSTLAAKTVYLVFNPSATQAYTGNITCSGGGAVAQNISVSGTGVALTPSLTVSPSSIAFGNVLVNTTAAQKTYSISAANLSPASGNITVSAPAGYLVSTTSGSGYASTATIAYSGSTLAATTIYVVFNPTTVQSYNVNISNTGGGATAQLVTVTGAGVQPVLSSSPVSLSFGNVLINTTSSEKTYNLTGANLSPASGSIGLTAPAGYEVSLTTATGFASSLAVSYSNNALASTTIYVRFKPTAIQAYSGNISNTGGGAATLNIAITGSGIQQTTSSTARYISPTGNDANAGTFAAPFRTITKAVSVAVAGDTIYMRGGSYASATTTSISKTGTAAARLYLLAYPGERPVLDFSAMAVSSSNRGINLSGSYWYIRGIDFYHAGDNGMFMSGSNNTIEFCNFYENSDTGLQIGGGGANNKILNCDSYYNADPANGNADGFAAKLDVGTGNYFYGCRAWQNSDDGWDGYLRPSNDVSTTLENCVCYKNGYLKSGAASAGNGNGFKMGGSDAKDLMHNFTLKNCLAVQNRVKGFDQNNNRGNMTLYNCTGYSNGTNYSIPLALNSGKTAIVLNCISAGTGGVSLGSFVIQTTDSWQPGFTVTNADFISVDATQAIAARNADGSLPAYTFMHLAAGSDLIDRGTNIGLPYAGSAPDLGCFESGTAARPASETILSTGTSLKVLPNVFSSSASIQFSVAESSNVTVKVMNSTGQTVALLYNGKAIAGINYKVQLNAGDLPSGTYYSVLQNHKEKQVTAMVITK